MVMVKPRDAAKEPVATSIRCIARKSAVNSRMGNTMMNTTSKVLLVILTTAMSLLSSLSRLDITQLPRVNNIEVEVKVAVSNME